MTRKYAASTDVVPERSVEEIRKYAQRRGAEEFTFAMGSRGGVVRFFIGGRPVQFVAEFPTDVDGTKFRNKREVAEQEYARRWRVVLLKIKTAFEVWQEGEESTVEEAFLAHLMLPDGTTVGQRAIEQLDGIYEGRRPSLDLVQAALPRGDD